MSVTPLVTPAPYTYSAPSLSGFSTNQSLALEDDSFNLPALLPSPTQAMALLAGGMAAGMAVPMPSRSSSHRVAQEMRSDASKILFLLNKPLYSLGALFERKPEFRTPLALYALVAGVGVLGASALQGIQEAWVRMEESRIRTQLVGRLTRVFAQSIRLKQQSDTRLMQQTQRSMAQLIAQNGLNQPWQWIHCAQAANASTLSGLPLTSGSTDALFPYQPTHRQLTPAGFGKRGLPTSTSFANTEPSGLGWAMGSALFGAGLLVGVLVKSIFGVSVSGANLKPNAAKLPAKARQLEESVTVYDLEAMVTEKAHLGDWRGMAGMLATGGLLGSSKLAIDGLRQVAVTRANANTEYRYQCTNWLSLDPAFHTVAENAAVQQQLQQFAAGLPANKAYPTVVVNQMSRILGGIGYHSAPKYFLMTPPVGLVDARG